MLSKKSFGDDVTVGFTGTFGLHAKVEDLRVSSTSYGCTKRL